MRDLEEIAAEAAQLDEDSRASLASRLLQSLVPPHPSISDEEVRRRMQEAEDDPSVLITLEEVIESIESGGD